MNKNEIFKKFLQNPMIKERVKLTEGQLSTMTLFNDTSNKLIDVIKTTIMHLDDTQSVDVVSRKINQSLKA